MEHVVTRSGLHASQQQAAADLDYWLAQSVQSRIDALEALRHQSVQGQPHAEIRVQRVFRVTQLKQG
jgi:HAMP domain-containing protein